MATLILYSQDVSACASVTTIISAFLFLTPSDFHILDATFSLSFSVCVVCFFISQYFYWRVWTIGSLNVFLVDKCSSLVQVFLSFIRSVSLSFCFFHSANYKSNFLVRCVFVTWIFICSIIKLLHKHTIKTNWQSHQQLCRLSKMKMTSELLLIFIVLTIFPVFSFLFLSYLPIYLLPKNSLAK